MTRHRVVGVLVNEHREFRETPWHILMALSAVEFIVIDSHAVEKVRIFLGGDLRQVGAAIRVVVLVVGLQKSDDLRASLVLGGSDAALVGREFPHFLVGILEFAGKDFIADEDFPDAEEIRVGFRPRLGGVSRREFHPGIRAKINGGVGLGDGLLQLALAPIRQAVVGFFALADILRTLHAEAVAEGVEHGLHAVGLEFVLEGFEVRLAAREDLGVHRERIAVIDPIRPAPGVGVEVEAIDMELLGEIEQHIQILGFLGADGQKVRVGEFALPLLDPCLGALVGPFAIDFRVRHFFLGPNA